MSPNAGEGVSCGVSANEYSCAQGAQINCGDLTPYLTYGVNHQVVEKSCFPSCSCLLRTVISKLMNPPTFNMANNDFLELQGCSVLFNYVIDLSPPPLLGLCSGHFRDGTDSRIKSTLCAQPNPISGPVLDDRCFRGTVFEILYYLLLFYIFKRKLRFAS
jgi:hypothetical protein